MAGCAANQGDGPSTRCLTWRGCCGLATTSGPAAEAAAEEAKRVQALYPEGSADPALVETLVNDIALAKEQG